MPLKEFSQAEQSIIKNMMLSKSHRDIAALLDCDKDDVSIVIAFLTEGTSMVTYQMRLDQQAELRKKPVTVKEIKIKPVKVKIAKAPSKGELERNKKRLDKEARMKQQLRNEQERKIRSRQPDFKTKQVDYNKMISVKVDYKTYIQVPAGSDIIAVKENYLKRMSDSKSQYKIVDRATVKPN